MALKRLTTDEMVQISGSWVAKEGEPHKALLRVPELSGLVPSVEGAHLALHATQPAVADPRLAALIAEIAGIDLAHDSTVRGVYTLLTALALLAGAGAHADALLKLRDILLPEGLGATQKTNRAEAGAAELLKTRLASEPDANRQIGEIPVLDHTVRYFVDRWMDSAKRLGDLEDERARLVGDSGPGDGAKVIAARNQWIRVVNALVANAALANLDEPTDQLLFGALRLAEKTADRRRAVGRDDALKPATPAVPATPATPAAPATNCPA